MSSTTPPSSVIDNFVERYPTLVTELGERDPVYQIWKSAWHEPDRMFDENDGFPVLRISVPATRMKKIFVRPEYVQAYEDALELYSGAVLETVDGMMEFATPDEASVFTLARTTENLHKRDSHPAFQDITRAMIITGHPGSGKTASLWYYLVRRLAIHEMVVYQDEPNRFFIFHDRGVAMVEITAQLRVDIMDSLPFSAWCLVDSNKDLVDPTKLIGTARRFLIQAASPNAAKSRWETKYGVSGQPYIMRPMSLQELMFVSHCQGVKTNQVEKFYPKYGPSAWGALFCPLDTWENDLELASGPLEDSPALINKIIQNLSKLVDDNPTLSSKIFLVSPSEKRNVPRVDMITEYVERKFVDWARKKWKDNSRAFYEMVMPGTQPASQSLAGAFFASHVHPVLAGGQVYLLTPLSRFRNTKSWSVREHPHQLILPASATTFRIQHPVDLSASPDDNKTITLKQYDRETPVLEDYVYYRPMSKTQVAIDSFVYSRRSNTILAFQITVSEKHPVYRSGLRWLKNLCALDSDDPPTISLVGISTKDKLAFACKDNAEEDIANFYHLKLEGPPSPRRQPKHEAESVEMEGIVERASQV